MDGNQQLDALIDENENGGSKANVWTTLTATCSRKSGGAMDISTGILRREADCNTHSAHGSIPDGERFGFEAGR